MPHAVSPPGRAEKPKFTPSITVPMTEDEKMVQETIHKAMCDLAEKMEKKGNHTLKDSMWASPQYNKRVLASTIKPLPVYHSAKYSAFFQRTSSSNNKIDEPASPPTNSPKTPPSGLSAMASVFVSGSSVTSSSSSGGVGISSSSWAIQPPTQAFIQGKDQLSAPAPKMAYIQPIVEKSVTSFLRTPVPTVTTQAQPAPPHLRGAAPVFTTQAQLVPPHLRGINNTSPHLQRPESTTTSTTQSVPPHLRGAPSAHPTLQKLAEIVPPQLGSLRSAVPSQAQSVAEKSAERTVDQFAFVALKIESIPPHLRGFNPVPPHLRGLQSAVSSQAQFAADKPAESKVEVVESVHLRRVEVATAPSQSVLPQLLGSNYVPRGTTPIATSTPKTVAPPPITFTQVQRTTPSQKPVDIVPVTPTKSSSTDSSVRLHRNLEQERFMQWLENRQATDRAEAKKKAAAKVSIKSEDTPSPQPQLASANLEKLAKRSSSTESVKSKMTPNQQREAAQKEAFLKHMVTATPFTYGGPRKSATPPKPVTPPKLAPLHNMSQRLTNAFDNKMWHLHNDTTKNFENFLRSDAAIPSSSQKWFNSGAAKSQQVQPAVNGVAQSNSLKLQIAQSTVPRVPQTPVICASNGMLNVQQNHGNVVQAAAPKAHYAPVNFAANGTQTLGDATHAAAPKVQQTQVTFVPNGTKNQGQVGQNASQPKPQAVQSRPELVENQKPVVQFGQKDPHAQKTQKTSFISPVPIKADPWPTMGSDMGVVAGMISSDIKVQPENSANNVPLTYDALVMTTGFKTAKESESSGAGISNTGIGGGSGLQGQDLRATRGNDATPLVDWDGKNWAPGPCDWECERGTFDDSFIPDFIKDWQRTLPCGPSVTVDTSVVGFIDGNCPVNNNELIGPIFHEDCEPDIAGSSDELKRLHQSAYIDANNFLVRYERKQLHDKRMIEASNRRFSEIAALPEEPNQFAPAIDMYLRPAEEKDAADIAAIYNHYIVSSIIPEDQQKVTPEDMLEVLKITKMDKLPFIVAVKGRAPTFNDAQGRPGSSKKAIMPAVELAIGFSFSERFNYGFAGKWNGRSRATANLQLFVHPDYTRKGVGRNLLDRLIHCITPSYAYRNGCSWINPTDNRVNESSGGGLFHQVLFQVPVEPTDDPTIDWLSKFLFKFYFKENDPKDPKRLKAVCRSPTTGNGAHFLDLAIFQYETLQDGEFDGYA